MKPHNNLVEELHFSLLMRVRRGLKTFNSLKEKRKELIKRWVSIYVIIMRAKLSLLKKSDFLVAAAVEEAAACEEEGVVREEEEEEEEEEEFENNLKIPELIFTIDISNLQNFIVATG